MTFIGGNPDESLFAILDFLNAAPSNWKLPVVWNCHGYASTETLALLHGIVDAFVPDFKYGSDNCAKALSNAPDYPGIAASAVSAMLLQDVPVIVRMLVLPGHSDCCHIPVLETLSAMDQCLLRISLRGQYDPACLKSTEHKDLNRKVSVAEMSRIADHAHHFGVRLVEGGFL